MTKLEEIARAIAKATLGADVWTRMASSQRAMFRSQARSAVETMRSTKITHGGCDAGYVWEHTIDAILNEDVG